MNQVIQMQENVAINRIADDLLATGVRHGGVLLVHSSLSSLGRVAGGPKTVILGLLKALGPAGTLLMPALSYSHVTSESPFFDVRRTPSNVGAIPEFFRTRFAAQRSVHPTHSVCGTGRHALRLLADHWKDSTPCGPKSPFHLLPDYQGQILMLGCGLRPNTSMHAIEELAEPPYLFGPSVRYRIAEAGGGVREKTYRRHGFTGYIQRYDRAAAILNESDHKTGFVLKSKAHVIESAALRTKALAALSKDPFYFVHRIRQ